MPSVCLYFKVHQPYRLKQYASSEIEKVHCYEDAETDKNNIDNVAEKCYLPANKIIYNCILAGNGNFKVAFSISGITIELLQKHRPDVIESFKELIATGCVDILGETYYHSLSSLYSKKEFLQQVQMHKDLIKNTFGITPVLFRNTELIYSNSIAETIAAAGFRGILCEGLERILCGRSCNKLYVVPGIESDFSIFLRNISLSDDIAFRFGAKHWNHHPLTAEKFAGWLHEHDVSTQVVNIFIDYETFGLHKNESTGIFDFLCALPSAILTKSEWKWSMPAEVIDKNYPKEIYDVPQTISWKDQGKTSCVWCENMMQNNTLKKIYSLENIVRQCNDSQIAALWRRLQTADYFYYMASDENSGERYANPFKDPKEAYGYYTNIITDLELTLIRKLLKTTEIFHHTSTGFLY